MTAPAGRARRRRTPTPLAGTYTVALTVTDDRGAVGDDHQGGDRTAANVKPTAAFSTSCTDLACSFDGSASADSDGTIASYAWYFGDTGPATGATATHTYAARGSFDVTLTVTDDDGATDSVMQTVTVAPANVAPAASFTIACTNLACSLDGSGSSDGDGTVASYAWDFGDGHTATTGEAGTHVRVGRHLHRRPHRDRRQGATGTLSKVVTVAAANLPPAAAFTASCTGLTCSFDATASSDPDGSIVAYTWDFGDGTSGSGMTTSHTYAAGTYTAELTVKDDKGATAGASKQVSPAAAPNQKPTAAFTPTPSGLTVGVDGSASSDPDGSVVAWAWTFGDGTSAAGATATRLRLGRQLRGHADRHGRQGGHGQSDEERHGGRHDQPATDGELHRRLRRPRLCPRRVVLHRPGRLRGGLLVGVRRRQQRHRREAVAHLRGGRQAYFVVLTVTDDKGATGYK